MAPRLPIPGSDAGNWGEILNEFLEQAHQPDGSLKEIPKNKLSSQVQISLDKADQSLDEQAAKTLVSDELANPVSTIATAAAGNIATALRTSGGEVAQAVKNAALSPVGNTIFYVGDSMTAQESSYASDASWRNITTRMLGDIASYGGVAAYGGDPIETIHAQALPILTGMLVKPTLVNIMCGTNNRGTDTPEQAAAKLWLLHEAVQALGCLTVAYTIPPRSDGVPWTLAFNALITAGAAAKGIPLVDLHALSTVDPTTGGWKSGLVIVSGDGIVHPNNYGCMEIAKLAAPVIRSVLGHKPWIAPLPLMSIDATNLASDPLFVNTADGVYPALVSGGIGGTRAAWSSYAIADTTVTYVDPPDGLGITGKMMKLVRSGTTGSTSGARSSTSTSAMPISAGDEIEFGCVFRVQNVQSNTTVAIGLSGSQSGNQSLSPGNPAFAWAIRQWRQNLDVGRCYQVFRVTDPPPVAGMGINVSIAGAVGAELYIGQLLIRNRTKAGLAALTPV